MCAWVSCCHHCSPPYRFYHRFSVVSVSLFIVVPLLPLVTTVPLFVAVPLLPLFITIPLIVAVPVLPPDASYPLLFNSHLLNFIVLPLGVTLIPLIGPLG